MSRGRKKDRGTDWRDAQAARQQAQRDRLAKAAGKVAEPEKEPAAPLTFSECIVGFRIWSIDAFGALRPQSVNHAPWVPGLNVAGCARQQMGLVFYLWNNSGYGGVPPEKHKAPHKNCECGLYARFDVESLPLIDYESVATGTPFVAGAIAAWGDVQVHRDGFRAEKACVVALAMPEAAPPELRDLLARIGKRYHAPVVPRAMLAQEAALHGSPLPEEAKPARRAALDLGAYAYAAPLTFTAATTNVWPTYSTINVQWSDAGEVDEDAT